MSVIEKIKSVLGLGNGAATRADRDTNVVVEHEPDMETGTESVEEPAETTPEARADATSVDEGEESDVEPGPEESTDDDRSVQSISGIGPAYADRLADAGVETVADLQSADPESLAEAADLSAKRIERWKDRAAE